MEEKTFGNGAYRVLVDKHGDIYLRIDSEQIEVRSWVMDEDVHNIVQAFNEALEYIDKHNN